MPGWLGEISAAWQHAFDDVTPACAEAGGYFIDTADVYQFGESEEILKGRREDFVLATKFTNGVVPNANLLVTGNSRKAMAASIEASLRRLKTDRIDLY